MSGPRRLVHRGRVLADGLWLEGPAASARALAHWAPGAILWSAEGGLVLRWKRPRRLDAEVCEGAPLVGLDGALWAFPPSPEERAALRPPAGALVRAIAGEARVSPEGPPLAPASLLSAEVAVLPLEGLGAPPAPPPALVAAPPLSRASFGQPPADPAGAEAVRAALTEAQAPSAAARALMGISAVLAAWRDRKAAGEAAGEAAGSAAPEGPSLSDRMLDWMDRALLGGLLRLAAGAGHARLLQQLFEDLDGGDMQRALRMAIPLDDTPGGKGGDRLSFGTPKPRQELRVGPALPARGSLGLEKQVFDELRAGYERAAMRLEHEGRYEDAAFVLAQLLGRAEAAVQLLERHARFALAADIAEARALPAARQVALRLRAGQTERALELARRGGVMLEAARLLEPTAPELARSLLLAHVALLAGSGQLLAALSALPAGRYRELEETLLRRLLERGGPAPVLAARRFIGSPALRGAWIAQTSLLLHELEGDPVLVSCLSALATLQPAEVRTLPEHEAIAALSCAAARLSLTLPECDAATRQSLAAHSPALLSDIGPLPPPPAPSGDRGAARHAEDRGALPVLDAAYSQEDGSLLLALGESGLELRAPGAPPRRYLAPAHRVVRTGTRALAMARRGEVWEIRAVDLVSGETTLWADLKLRHHLPHLSRGLWLVAEDTGLALLDPLSPGARALWRGGPTAPVEAMAASDDDRVWAIATTDGTSERWSWSRQDLLLRERTPVPAAPSELALLHIRDDGAVFAAQASPTDAVLALWALVEGAWEPFPAVPIPARCHPGPLAICSAASALFIALAGVEGGVLVLRLLPDPKRCHVDPLRPWTLLQGARTAGLRRADAAHALAWDELGRVLLLELSGRVVREWRS